MRQKQTLEHNLRRVGNLKTSRDTIVKERPIVHVCWSVNVRQINSRVSTTAVAAVDRGLAVSFHS